MKCNVFLIKNVRLVIWDVTQQPAARLLAAFKTRFGLFENVINGFRWSYSVHNNIYKKYCSLKVCNKIWIHQHVLRNERLSPIKASVKKAFSLFMTSLKSLKMFSLTVELLRNWLVLCVFVSVRMTLLFFTSNVLNRSSAHPDLIFWSDIQPFFDNWTDFLPINCNEFIWNMLWLWCSCLSLFIVITPWFHSVSYPQYLCYLLLPNIG